MWTGRKLVLAVISCFWLDTAARVEAPKPVGAVPTKAQLAWQSCETNLFLHFGVNTFTDREWGTGQEDPRVFNPSRLDARQWARAAKAGGFKIVILTAKHHDGFCLWPSRYTDHSVRSSPWRDGKGDVVRELADACRESGLKLGLYLSPWDRHEQTYGDSSRYNEYYKAQMAELLTGYGPIAEVWFDGACGEGPNGKRQEYDWEGFRALVRKLQPEAVMFSDAGPDVRWIGNERGTAGDPCWATVDPAKVPYPGAPGEAVIQALQHGDPGGSVWRPGESDVSIRPGWFWHRKEDDKVRSTENLVDLYFKSVGRNSLMLLNVPPNDQGLLSEPDVRRLAEFRARLDFVFRTDLARGAMASAGNTRGNEAAFAPARALDGDGGTFWATDDDVTSSWLEVDLGRRERINISSIQEAIALGQRVESYHLECQDGESWREFTRGTTIGHKRLDRFDAVTAQRIRLVIDRARACPAISSFSLYFADTP
jgi:alpha-L-fucosidase